VSQAIVTPEDAAELRRVREMVLEIIAVDEFESEMLQLGKLGQEPLPTSEAA
jgi:hypothetical protein